MDSNTLFKFRTPTTNRDYLSLYRWVKPSANNTGNTDTINLQDSMSGILSKISDNPALKMNKEKYQLSSQEREQCNALYLELLENISDVFTKMPNYVLIQLPGYNEVLCNDIKSAIDKLKGLQTNIGVPMTKTSGEINDHMESAIIGNNWNDITRLTEIIDDDNVDETIPLELEEEKISNAIIKEEIVEELVLKKTGVTINAMADVVDLTDSPLESTSNADTSHIRIELPPDQINHGPRDVIIENVEPDTAHEQPLDTSVYSHDHIYLSSTLKHNFRLQNFREKQIEAINAARFGHNCFIMMPAGSGKSLCYQMPAILSAGVTVVVSPLISMIREQILQLNSLKIKVAHLTGKLGKKAETLIYNELKMDEPEIKLLYVTPEKLMKNSELNEILVSLNDRGLISRFVVDEAQCVVQWGVGFREAYSILYDMRAKFEIVPVTALTSCATKGAIDDIQHLLRMSDCKIFRTSLNRPNISYNVSNKDEIDNFNEYIATMILDKYPRQSGIIYCLTCKQCEEMARVLVERGVSATAYHSGQSEKVKNKAASDWKSNNCLVICGTMAFGMGIEKPDIRFVIHDSLPPSIEAYYQGTGRAGRDGREAKCHLFFSQNTQKHEQIINWNTSRSDPDLEKTKENRKRLLKETYDFCTNKDKCRRLALLEYFNDEYNNTNCGQQHACDYCRNNMEKVHFDEEDNSMYFL